MSGLGAYLFRAIGAFIRWAITGFKANYKEIFDGPRGDNEKTFMNDLLNITIAIFFIAAIFITLQLILY